MRSFASHKGSIWDLCSFTLPVVHADTAAGSDGSGSDVVQGCATCGKDGIQFWDFCSPADALRPLSLVTAGKCAGCNCHAGPVHTAHTIQVSVYTLCCAVWSLM